ncbi:MAG: type IV secretion system DNA-binding domain-containing protein [Nitrosopumilus sp.]|nr:type IV secretion system DNA-binding domain-containing protein [Nitrosopumilus sp.]MDH3852866.1 type IV secretion system DNA-binding domain-containing protein [Nitrosopumilus sp.]
MVSKWTLAVESKQLGALDKITEFSSPNQKKNQKESSLPLRAVEIVIPIDQDIKKAVITAGSIISSSVRSFELIWDKKENRLSFWLVSNIHDITHYVDAFKSVYPNADFENLDYTIPEWFDPRTNYKVFDASVRHGNFFAVMDHQKTPALITQISNTIQMAQYGWIQFIFQRHDITNYINSFSQILDSMKRKVSNTKYRSEPESLFSDYFQLHNHPEFGGDFARNYKTLKHHAEFKTINPQMIMSIRGLINSDGDLDFGFDVIENISLENIHAPFEHCTKNSYDNYRKFYNSDPKKAQYIKIGKRNTNCQRIDMFSLRLLPKPEGLIQKAFDNYAGTNMFGRYHKRKPLPFLLLNTSEMPLFIHLPDVTVKHLRLTRGQTLPRTSSDKIGFRLGLFEIDKINDKKYPVKYGEIVSSNDISGVTVHYDDYTRHQYVVAASGAGKSTLLRSMAKHIEMANLNGVFNSAFVYADFKGGRNPDSIKFIKQLDQKTLHSGKVLYLDPSETNFAINPLELPRNYDGAKREEIVDRYIGYFMRIMEQFYSQKQTYVQMERIMKVILQYLYSFDDAPTFRDIYEIVAELESGGQQVLSEIFETLGKPEAELYKALTSISELKPDTFSPLLNRLEPFSTSPILKRIFTTKHSSVDFSTIVQSGSYTVVSMNETNMSSIAAPLAQMAFVLKIWFEVQEQSRNKETKMKDVILVLDEFQIIAGLDTIPMILAQARSFGLGLCLAHQNLSQIPTELLQTIVGNTATQFAGRLSGIDASKIGMIIDPKYGKDIAAMLAVQSDFRFLARTRPILGEETSLPPQFWLDYPCTENMTDEQFSQFIMQQKEKYGNVTPEETLLVSKNVDKNKWMQQLENDITTIPPKTEWQILVSLYSHEKLSLMEIVRICNFTQPRDDISKLLRNMNERKLIEIAEKIQKGRVTIIKYQLSNETKIKYFDLDYSKIGTASDISDVAKNAVEHYLKEGHFVSIAVQDFSKKDELRTDLIAYDYSNDMAISVEIESHSEVESHPEHVLLNMKKWKEMGFSQCHVWSKHKQVVEIKEKIDFSMCDNVKAFLVS